MPKAEAGTAPLQKGAGDRFSNKVNPLVVAGAIQREEEIRNRFVTRWGEILDHGSEGPPPTTVGGVIDAKKAALAQLRAQMEGRPGAHVPQLTTYALIERSGALMAEGATPEAGIKQAYKVMKAGT